MAKDYNEYGDLKLKSAVADLTGRRQGTINMVMGKGTFRVVWSDGEVQVLDRGALRARYTTTSVRY